jgi:hypothetical protein
MIWNILKKDAILLWPLAGLCVLAQVVLATLMFLSDAQPEVQALLLAARLSVAVVFLIMVFTIAFVVHQDPMPGTRQDWLVRPIRRKDLLVAKLLFVLLVVHLPMLLCDVGGGLARGFAFGDTLGAALIRNLNLLVMVTLPALGFAAMTANVAQFLGAGVAYFILSIVGTILLGLSARFGGQEQATNPLFWTGVAWIAQTVQRVALAAGAVVALALLYSRRKIITARSLFPAFALASALVVLTPWSWFFALQAAASAATPGPAFQAAFDPAAPRYRLAAGEAPDAYGVGAAQVQLRGRAAGDIGVENQFRQTRGDVTVFAPLKLAGVPAGVLPFADRAVVRLTGANGELLFQGRGDDLKLDRGDPAAALTRGYEAIRVPALLYEKIKDQPLTLEIDYSVSLLQPQAPVSAAALGADVSLPGLGRCATDRDEDGDEVALRCIKPGRAPSCLTSQLQDPASGRRNPVLRLCSPDYAPYVVRPFPDGLSRFEVETPFRDRQGLAAYPVSGEALSRAQLVVTRYEASAHLTRRVTAAGVRLSDWTAAKS